MLHNKITNLLINDAIITNLFNHVCAVLFLCEKHLYLLKKTGLVLENTRKTCNQTLMGIESTTVYVYLSESLLLSLYRHYCQRYLTISAWQLTADQLLSNFPQATTNPTGNQFALLLAFCPMKSLLSAHCCMTTQFRHVQKISMLLHSYNFAFSSYFSVVHVNLNYYRLFPSQILHSY